jgi:hypothetical protein
MTDFRIHRFPKSRMATIDVCSVGLQKHHVTAIIEIDVSESWEKIKQPRAEQNTISLTGWLIYVISNTVKEFERVAGYLQGKRSVLVFNDINVSIIVEKELNGQQVPTPLLIEKGIGLY